MTGSMREKVSIVIPTFNDQFGLKKVLVELFDEGRSTDSFKDVIVVDDGSEPPIFLPSVKAGRIRLIRHAKNKGYGSAIKTGIRAAQSEFILLMDADGQHDPNDIPALLEKAPDVDLVVGIRPNSKTSPLWRRPGKWILTRMLNSLAPMKLRDINCGFRCFRRESILKILPLCSNRFSFSISSTMLCLSLDYAVDFVPVNPRMRSGTSTMSWTTGLDTVLLIIRMIVLVEPLRFFLPISFFLLATGFIWALPYALQGKGLSVGALFLMLASLIVFLLGVLSEQITAVWKSRRYGP